MRRPRAYLLVLLLWAGLTASQVTDPEVTRDLSRGGGASSGGPFTVRGTIADDAASAPMQNAGFQVIGGFLARPTGDAPLFVDGFED